MFMRLHSYSFLKLSTVVITTWQYAPFSGNGMHVSVQALVLKVIKVTTSLDVLLFFSGPPTECFMFHSRAAVAKLHSANEVRADYFVSNC